MRPLAGIRITESQSVQREKCVEYVEMFANIIKLIHFTLNTRSSERFYIELGINSVPSTTVNSRYLTQGGQPPQDIRTGVVTGR